MAGELDAHVRESLRSMMLAAGLNQRGLARKLDVTDAR